MAETLTVLEVLRRSTEYLDGKGVESARLNAELIVSHALALDRMKLYLQFERPLGARELETMRANVTRRGKREPLQYVLGETKFHDLALKTDARALIPRPETEQLVESIKDKVVDIDQAFRILDLGTGTGAIALTLAMHYPLSIVTAVDSSVEALELANENCLLTGLQSRVTFRESDWFSEIGADESFDIIVSNPPYLTNEEARSAEPEVKDFEPYQALVASDDGIADLVAIANGAFDRLSPDGSLWMESGIEHRERLRDVCQKRGYSGFEGFDDWSGRPRFARAWL